MEIIVRTEYLPAAATYVLHRDTNPKTVEEYVAAGWFREFDSVSELMEFTLDLVAQRGRLRESLILADVDGAVYRNEPLGKARYPEVIEADQGYVLNPGDLTD